MQDAALQQNSNATYNRIIASELSVKPAQVQAVAALLSDDATVPFIARYRKEATGSLDEVQITTIRDRLLQLTELDKRRAAILKSLSEREILTDELQTTVNAASDLATLEDIYLPYRPKRRTRATIAAEKGLTPLAEKIYLQDASVIPANVATEFINADKGVDDIEAALAGARDIIAEKINEDAAIRSSMRELFFGNGEIFSKVTKGKNEEGIKFSDYFDWNEPVKKAGSHRILAMLRGETEGILKLSIRPLQEEAFTLLERKVLKNNSASAEEVQLAAQDCYSRLLAPAMENEVRAELKEKADEEAINVFVQNIRELLMSAPLGQKSLLALDPGFRTGCKLVILSPQGQLLHDTVIYPTQSQKMQDKAAQTVQALCSKYKIEAIAIGNGTAGRETETFIRNLALPGVIVIMVNESGASVYSASEAAREEFPGKDLTVRGAVSIGRRLIDPLSELVKIDPKAIGVGQYQHDVNQTALKQSLDDTVMSCVNAVGVEVNTASRQLLAYVSGLGPKLADNIVLYRDKNGPFNKRTDLKKVPRLGAKAFEQCGGFLRIRGGKDPLDASAVHPERYELVKKMASDNGCSVEELIRDPQHRSNIDLNNYIDDSTGMPTLQDIMQELARPGRDPREKFEAFAFAENVHSIDDLHAGMVLPGIVTNVTQFGAFVDVGAHQDGLVHISQLADDFVSDPATVVKVQQKVRVTVMEVDTARKRISLSMRSNPELERKPSAKKDKNSGNKHTSKPTPAKQKFNKVKQPQHQKQQPQNSNNWFANALKDSQKKSR